MNNSKKLITTTSSLLPFYNEGNRVLVVLETLTKVKNLKEIICVDDGSSDGSYSKIRVKFPKANLVRLPKNIGKTKAVEEGLKRASGQNILLFDADLRDIKVHQIEKAIEVFQSQKDLGMIILRRMHDPWINRLIRTDIVISGQRILRRKDLERVLGTKPRKFQLELAINNFMQENGKVVYWMPLSCRDIYKRQKYGLIKGTLRELEMYKDFIAYKGIAYYLKNLAFFCRKIY